MKAKRARSEARKDLSIPIEAPDGFLTALVASRYPADHPAYRAVYEAAQHWVPATKMKRLFNLLERHGISARDPNCWLYLSLRLAEELYEGFKVGTPKKRGRPKRIDPFDLVQAVENEISTNGCEIVEACRRLSNAKGGKWRKKPVNSLVTRYHEYKKSVANRTNRAHTGFVAFLIDAGRSAEASLSTTTNP